MLTLREFLSHKRKYIAAIYDTQTQDNLREWCQKNGFDLSMSYNDKPQDPREFKFHTTIFYTETIHSLGNGEFELEKPFKVRPFAFELLGENKDVPVMKVDGHGLYKQREYYEETFEMRDKWKSYLPHVSLTYVRNAETDFSKIKLPKFPLIVNKIEIDDIDSEI